MAGMAGTGKSGMDPTDDEVEGLLEVNDAPECIVLGVPSGPES